MTDDQLDLKTPSLDFDRRVRALIARCVESDATKRIHIYPLLQELERLYNDYNGTRCVVRRAARRRHMFERALPHSFTRNPFNADFIGRVQNGSYNAAWERNLANQIYLKSLRANLKKL